jgi:molybdopterin-containing oxidoreductase family iron-sulfur binding subunit
MEKCTFCVQRIHHAKLSAKERGTPVQDAEITTACEQACPTKAITFGDIANPKSRVSIALARPRAYRMLEELNTRPHVSYLARVRNPNPEITSWPLP